MIMFSRGQAAILADFGALICATELIMIQLIIYSIKILGIYTFIYLFLGYGEPIALYNIKPLLVTIFIYFVLDRQKTHTGLHCL